MEWFFWDISPSYLCVSWLLSISDLSPLYSPITIGVVYEGMVQTSMDPQLIQSVLQVGTRSLSLLPICLNLQTFMIYHFNKREKILLTKRIFRT